jgi:transcriptional regulator with XRE-family HTH domain
MPGGIKPHKLSRSIQERALELREKHGLTYKAIATRLGLSTTGARQAANAAVNDSFFAMLPRLIEAAQ